MAPYAHKRYQMSLVIYASDQMVTSETIRWDHGTAGPYATVEKHFCARASTQRSLHCATPDFRLRLVALASYLRLSLMKAAYAVVSGAAWQEIRVRFGRDDKAEGGASMESNCGMEAAFHQLGWAQRPMTPTDGMTILLGIRMPVHKQNCHPDRHPGYGTSFQVMS